MDIKKAVFFEEHCFSSQKGSGIVKADNPRQDPICRSKWNIAN
jgi:hypothetical protein